MSHLKKIALITIVGIVACVFIAHVSRPKEFDFWTIAIFGLFALVSFSSSFKKVELFHPAVSFPIVYFYLYGSGTIYLYMGGDDSAFTVLMYSCIGIVFYQIGVAAAMFGQQSVAYIHDYRLDWNRTKVFDILKVIIPISILAALVIYVKLGIPILSTDIFDVRARYGKVTHYVFFLLRNIGLVFHFYFVYHFLQKNPKYRLSKKYFLCFMLGSFLLLLSTASRADLLFFLAPFVIEYHYLRKKLELFKVITTAMMFLLTLVGLNYYRLFTYSGEHETLIYLQNRFHGNAVQMFLYHFFAQTSLVGTCFKGVIDNIPLHLNFFHGSLIPQTLSTFLPGHQSPPGEILKESAGLQFTGGQVNLTLLGDFYSDFGIFGIVAGMLFLGLVAGYVYRLLLQKRTSSALFLHIIVTYSFIVGIPGGLFSQAIRYYYLLIVVIIIFYVKKKNSSNGSLRSMITSDRSTS